MARLCSQERIWSSFAEKRGLNRRSGPPVHDDLVDRQFGAQAANEVWLTDITEHRTDEGKLYLCAIKDVYSNRIVGYSIDSRMKASLAVAALDHAIARRSPFATIVHSDRGSQQFRSRKFDTRCRTTGYVVRWTASARAVTTRRWSPFRAAATHRPGPATVGHPGGVAVGDHHLD